MNKDQILISFLSIMIFVGAWLGYQAGSTNKKEIYDNLIFLIHSDRNLEAITGIKTLESLKTNNKDITVKEVQMRVKFFLTNDGIQPSTIERAIKYQQKHCAESCLGV